MSGRPVLSPEAEERLARYRAGAMTTEERRAFEMAALADDTLAEALYFEEAWDAALTPAPRVADARPALARRGLGWWLPRVALPAAACVAVLAGLLHFAQQGRAPQDDPLRGGGAGARPLAPVGDVTSRPEAFTWSKDAGAAAYRVDLFAPDGTRLATVVTADTTLAASALTPRPLGGGAWRVVPLGPDGLERAAEPRVPFRVESR